MGSATIVDNKGNGYYTIKLKKGELALQVNRTAINERIQDIENKLVDLRSERLSLVDTFSLAYDAMRNAVAAFASVEFPTAALRKAVTDAQAAYIRADANVKKKQSEIDLQVQALTGLQKSLTKIEEHLVAEYKYAWCADYSDLLAGDVGTLEVNGETDEIIIMPGGEDGEGLIYDSAAMSPSGWFYNLALFPGWQKAMPTYRIGEIVSIDYDHDRCDVALDDDRSRVRGLPINEGGTTYQITKDEQYGWADFCARNPGHPLVVNAQSTTIPMTDKLRADMDSVQADVNNRYTYRLDQDRKSVV